MLAAMRQAADVPLPPQPNEVINRIFSWAAVIDTAGIKEGGYPAIF